MRNPSRPLADRFWEKVDATGDCWDWTAAKTKDGYGAIGAGGRGGRTLMAHRVVFDLLCIPIPEGMEADHLCFRRHCVNPDHIEIVTPHENKMRQRRGPSISHCKHGHAMVGYNVIERKSGGRTCRSCRDAANKASSLRRSLERKSRRS